MAPATGPWREFSRREDFNSNMDASLKVPVDNTAKLFKAIAAIAKTRVLIGVNSDEVEQYAWVQNYGSPLQNIEALHFFENGIQDARNKIVTNMGQGIQAAVSGDHKAAVELVEAAADAAVAAIQERAPVRTGALRDSIEATVEDK